MGMLADGQAETLRDAGLDYYNHNLDSAPDFYGDKLLTTPNPEGNDDLALLARLGLQTGQPVARA